MAKVSSDTLMEMFLKELFVDDKKKTGQLFLADLNLNLAAEFSGDDLPPILLVKRFRLYYVTLKNPDGSVYREGCFSNGNFIMSVA